MRKILCVPMMALLLLCGCGREEEVRELQRPYQEMEGCTMEAKLLCSLEDNSLWEALLSCDYLPEGKSEIRVLEPESIAGTRAVLEGETRSLCYEGLCLNVGDLSREKISPVEALPQMMSALREGWLLEENRESLQDTPCTRLMLDQSGPEGGKIITTLWLKEEDGLPLRGEIAVEGERIYLAEFTSFSFYDKIEAPK